MWFLWRNWRKSTFYPVTAPNGSKCWPIVTSSIQEPVASNCDVTMTNWSCVVAMDTFLGQWWGQWSQHSGRPRTFLALISLLNLFFMLFYVCVFQHGASLVDIINCVYIYSCENSMGCVFFCFVSLIYTFGISPGLWCEMLGRGDHHLCSHWPSGFRKMTGGGPPTPTPTPPPTHTHTIHFQPVNQEIHPDVLAQ